MCEYEFFTVFLHFESIKLEIMAKYKVVYSKQIRMETLFQTLLKITQSVMMVKHGLYM